MISRERFNKALDAVKQQWGTEPFESGQCAALALALYQWLSSQNTADHLDVVVLFRHERDSENDDEIFSTTLSHVMLEWDGELFDIHGPGADERWEARIEETIEPSEPYFFNDTEYENAQLKKGNAFFLSLTSDYDIDTTSSEQYCGFLEQH